MVTTTDIAWFKTHFAAAIDSAVQGSVFDSDMLTAIACQETGSLWAPMRRRTTLTPQQIAALCCGDTLDSDRGRRAFPRTRADLLAVPDGDRMFAIARQALLAMAQHVPGFGFANTNTRKFCHGFGVFQYDLQFFLTNPSYFLDRKYEDFGESLNRALGELTRGLRRLGLQNRSSISDLEFCHVAIVYNTGRFIPARGLKQGHEVDGKFYGEFIRDFLAMARAVPAPNSPAVSAPAAGTAPVQPAETLTAAGPLFRVETVISTARMRSEPRLSTPRTANVRAELPDGHILHSITGTPVNGFIEGETMLGGRLFRGFVSQTLLVPVTPAVAVAAAAAAAAPPAALASLPAAELTNRPGVVTKRTALAGAVPLNEPDMPRRAAQDPAGLRAELNAIVDYLKTDDARHKRYAPRDGLTFCNIYAYDYCMLAGAYLPRVWWTQPALLRIAAGQVPEAKLGATVDEVRANGLFRWLRDFGQNFGWRRAASATELQDHANLGGVALIVARRREDGRSGHIVMVVPETADDVARRNAAGAVTMPLQSQAGSTNFRRGLGIADWWSDARFAEAAFWLHG